jgi:hypothetical protein
MIVINDRLQITRGEDRTVIFKIRELQTKDPIDLTGFTNITIVLIKANREKLILDNSLKPAVKAHATVNTVKIIADNAGGFGNSIILPFNGVDDIDTIVEEWNESNPTNTVSHNGTGVEIFATPVRLSGGLESYRAVSVDGKAVLGRVKMVLTELDTLLLRRGNNQSVVIVVDWGFPPSGIRRIAKFDNKLDVLE